VVIVSVAAFTARDFAPLTTLPDAVLALAESFAVMVTENGLPTVVVGVPKISHALVFGTD
jgi:hypothetical protein